MYVLTVRFVTMTTNPIDDCDFFYRCSSNGNLITQPAEHFPASNLADPIPTPASVGGFDKVADKSKYSRFVADKLDLWLVG